MPVDLTANACDCSDGYCKKFCVPATECIHRIARLGEIKTDYCVKHQSDTWHLKGECLKCQRLSIIEELIRSHRHDLPTLFTPPTQKYLTLEQITQLHDLISTAQRPQDANEQIRALDAAQRILREVK